MSFSISKIPFLNTVTQEGYLVVKHFKSLPFETMYKDVNLLVDTLNKNDVVLIDNCGLVVKGSSLTHV